MDELNSKPCACCKQMLVLSQFLQGDDSLSATCNNCLLRYGITPELLQRFMLWSRTTKGYEECIGSVTSVLFGSYSALEIERLLLLASVDANKRKTLLQDLMQFTKDTGDQLLLVECMIEFEKICEGRK